MSERDEGSYYRFTGPARLDKAVHTLEGMLMGMSADKIFSADEVLALKTWMHEHKEFADRHPFNELFPVLARALTDERIDEEEARNLVWLCSKMGTDNTYYCAITSDIQRLHGIIAGIIADEIITMEELDVLDAWLEEHQHLRTCWPYDELEGLLLNIKKDGKIDRQEHGRLLTFLSEFASVQGHRSLDLAQPDANATIMGVCAVDPQIVFAERMFCLSGMFMKGSKSELKQKVESRKGFCVDRVTKSLNYLVVGSKGNPCWAYATYGRKVEEVLEHRKKGSHMLIIHESDFWDSVLSTE